MSIRKIYNSIFHPGMLLQNAPLHGIIDFKIKIEC